jgi:2-dehydropantoate 2-reductase
MSTTQGCHSPRGKRYRNLQHIIGIGVKWIRWREYGTHAGETAVGETSSRQDLLSPPASDPGLVEEKPNQPLGHQAVRGSLNYLQQNDWSSRGRGESWFLAWHAAGEEKPDDPLETQHSKGQPVSQNNGSDNSQSNLSGSLEDTRRLLSAEEEETEAIRASPSFKRDLASLDAGLIHNPANGTVRIMKEVDYKVPPEEILISPVDTANASHAMDQESDAMNDISESVGIPGLDAPRSKAGVGAALQRSLQRVQGLFFPPWRPYTHINLNLDPEGEYIDPDMGNSDRIQPEPALDQEEQIDLVLESKLENPTIHVLGLGTVGKYIAHALASLPHAPPITLLMHRPLVMQHWHDEGAAIRLVKDGQLYVQSNFNIESAASFQRESPDQVFPHFGENLEHSAEPPDTAIDTLIVTTDSWTTLPALEAIRHRIRQRTTIFFVQSGLGIAEKVSATVFTDPDRRPTYVLGSLSHHITSTDRHFTIIQTEPGTLICSKQPQREVYKTGDLSITRHNFSWSPQAKHLVGSLTRALDLNTQALGHKSFYKTQLQKVVLGCIIGPLSVMYDCSTDKLLYNYNASVTMVGLLKEISLVIRSLPELQSLDGIDRIFNLRKLEAMCVSAIAKTGATETLMLQSVRAGRRTNIDYFNGYIIRRAAQMGISCPRNELILRMVEGKRQMRGKEITGYIPMISSH